MHTSFSHTPKALQNRTRSESAAHEPPSLTATNGTQVPLVELPQVSPARASQKGRPLAVPQVAPCVDGKRAQRPFLHVRNASHGFAALHDTPTPRGVMHVPPVVHTRLSPHPPFRHGAPSAGASAHTGH